MSVMPFVRAFGISGNVHEESNHRIDCVFLYDMILMLYKGIGAWTKTDESDSGNFFYIKYFEILNNVLCSPQRCRVFKFLMM